jgi:hypothetical protein
LAYELEPGLIASRPPPVAVEDVSGLVDPEIHTSWNESAMSGSDAGSASGEVGNHTEEVAAAID